MPFGFEKLSKRESKELEKSFKKADSFGKLPKKDAKKANKIIMGRLKKGERKKITSY